MLTGLSSCGDPSSWVVDVWNNRWVQYHHHHHHHHQHHHHQHQHHRHQHHICQRGERGGRGTATTSSTLGFLRSEIALCHPLNCRTLSLTGFWDRIQGGKFPFIVCIWGFPTGNPPYANYKWGNRDTFDDHHRIPNMRKEGPYIGQITGVICFNYLSLTFSNYNSPCHFLSADNSNCCSEEVFKMFRVTFQNAHKKSFFWSFLDSLKSLQANVCNPAAQDHSHFLCTFTFSRHNLHFLSGWELLRDPAGRDHFLAFLEREYATENLLFVEVTNPIIKMCIYNSYNCRILE